MKLRYALINGIAHEHNVAQTRQVMLEYVNFRWSPIDNVMIAPRGILVVPGREHFIHVSFDYEMQAHPFEIVKVSERCKTTVFSEKYSYN